MASSARIEELRKKFEENPRRYFAPLANEYRKAGDIDQAIAICREYLPQQPGHMSGHIVYGQALYEARQVEESKTVFETALALDPENLIALRHLGDLALMVGDSQGARTWYGRVLEADPRNEEIQAQLATLDQPAGGAVAPVAQATSAAAAPPSAPPEPPPQVAPSKPTPSSAPTVVISAQPKLQPWAKQPATPVQPLPQPVPPTQPVTAQSPTAEIVLEALPTAQSPTAEIRLDTLPGVPRPEVEKPAEAALGLEPTSIQMPVSFGAQATLEIDHPISQNREAPPLDSFSLEGLETTSMASAPQASAPERAPTPMADLDFGTPTAPPAAQVSSPPPAAMPTPVVPVPAVAQADDDIPLLDIGEIPVAPVAPAPPAPPAPPVAALRAPESVHGAAPEVINEPVAEESVPAPESGPFVTETMAELYLQQGHREEALKVYRALLEQRPGDGLLSAKVEALSGQGMSAPEAPVADQGPSIRDLLSAIASRRPGFRQELPQTYTENGGTPVASHPAAESYAEPEAYSAPESIAQAAEAPPASADALSTIFGGVEITAADEGAATALAYAFVALDGLENGTAPEEISGAPAHTAANELSLDAVFKGDAAKTAAPSNFSFDQFFSQRATADQPIIPAGMPPAGGSESRDDAAQFTQWLEGLKQR